MNAPSASLLVRNTVWNGVGRIGTVAIALFLTPYVIARIGQDAFGLWALSNLLVGYLSVADFGIQSSLIRQIAYARPAEDPRQLDRIVSTSVLFYVGLFALTAPLAYFAAPWITGLFTVPPELYADAEFVVALTAAFIFYSIATAVFTSILPGLQRMDYSNQLTIASSVVNLGATVLVLESGWGVRGLVVAGLAVKTFTAGTSWLVVRKLYPSFRVSFADYSWDVWKELFSFGWKIQVSRICELLTFTFDRIFLSVYGGIAALGRYQPAVQVATQTRMLPHLLVMAALPYASELSAMEDRKTLLRLYFRGTLYLTFFAFGILGFTGAAAPFLTTAWLGPGYADVALWIRIFSVGYLFNAPMSLAGLISQAIGRPGIQARSAMIGTVLNCTFAPLGFYFGDITGLTIGATLAVVVATIWFTQALHRAMDLRTLTVLRECFLQPSLWLLAPAVVIAGVLQQFTAFAATRADSILVIAAASVVYGAIALVGATRMNLWAIRKHLASSPLKNVEAD
jgi:O-antigen/teichoic acid export membrane protein